MNYEIRSIQLKDASGINAMRRMPGVFENILGIPSERLKRSEDFIQNMGPNSHQFVAVTTLDDGNEVVIGTAGLSVYENPRLRHSGSIGIMIHKDYQGMRVGTALMEALLDIADNWLMLVRVDLTVFVDNERAIQLYKNMGFEQEGVKKMGSIRNGEYVDELIMSRIRLK